MTEHIVAVFHDAADADAAAQELHQTGVPAGAVRRYAAKGDQVTSTGQNSRAETGQPSGFWAWLLGEEGPRTTSHLDYRADADAFERSASQGDTVLSVTLTDDNQIHRTVEVLEAHNPIGIDESTEEEVQEGSTATMEPSPASGSVESREETIPLAREELEIGKRKIDRGTTRVRRYVVETPVERQVELHGERVTIERRHPTTGSGPTAAQFEERVIEVHETDEEPVVQKSARTDEEVVIRREPTERTETVRDTVRHEDVEVTPDRTDHKTTP